MATWDTRPLNIIVPVIGGLLYLLFYLGHAWWTAREQPDDYVLRKYNRWYYYIAWGAFSLLVLWYAQPLYANSRAYTVSSQSAENALFVGDYLYADMSAYDSVDPARGDVIVFIFPHDLVTQYIHRCVALPGDTVEIVDKILYVNGAPADEPATLKYIDTTSSGQLVIQPRRSGGADSRDNFGPYVLAEQEYFVLGDNRDNSFDSRFWGPVPRELVLGKAVRVYYSSDFSRVGMKIE